MKIQQIATFAAILFSGLMAVSCEISDQYLSEDLSEETGVPVTFTVTKSDNETADTKVNYPSHTGAQLVWTVGDKIGVYSASKNSSSVQQSSYTLFKSTAGTNIGRFIDESNWKWLIGRYDVYIFYPYNQYTRNAKKNFDIPVRISQLQKQSGPNTYDNLSDNKFVYSSKLECDITGSTDIPITQLTNLTSTIRFTATELNPGEKITSITLTPSTGILDLGYEGIFNIRSENLTISSGYTSIRLEIGNGGLANGDVAYMSVNNGFKGRSFKFFFEVTSQGSTQPSVRAATRNNQIGKGQTTTVFNYSNGFRPNVILDVSLSGKHSADLIADVQVWAKGDIKDLNAGKGRANCYVVGTNGKFKFDGNYCGNSSLEADKLDLSGATVTKIWEDYPNLIDDPLSDSGKILITTHGVTGNAVVGWIKNGVILWSWHIWVTETGTVGTITQDNVGVFLDQNLGATSTDISNPASYGVYYQWGRKDPFTPSTTDHWENSEGSLELAIANPTIAYAQWHGNGTYDTVTIRHSQWWIETLYHDNSWGSYGTSGFNSGALPLAKSKYDPCPYGYRVPTSDEYLPSSMLPKAGWGRSDGWNTSIYNNNGYYWSNVVDKWTDDLSYRFHFSGSNSIQVSTDKRNWMMSVRCVKDDIHL